MKSFQIDGIRVDFTITDRTSEEYFYAILLDALKKVKSRGVKDLKKVLNRILVRPYSPDIDYKTELGIYVPSRKTMYIVQQVSKTDVFKNEYSIYFNTVIHEIGHAIEENLHIEALREWQTPWVEYNFNTLKNDRAFIMKVIKELFIVEGDISKITFRNLADRIKLFLLFSFYLNENELDDDAFFEHLNKKSPFTWDGFLSSDIEEFFSNPDNKGLDFDEYPEEVLELFNQTQFENGKVTRYLEDLNYQVDLGLPSKLHYNPNEDFAETFRLWLLTPNRLSEKQTERFLKTLWLSGFYGKPILKKSSKHRLF